ncbi:extracellular solute-binding protein [Dactylosporangium aurantiacum]|uniref:Extracellular solute-binding protein n=1 Tax=Dactylosporangium aurantiacum TaxID=35754 RepID=A0A9Q9MET9_9ACTN|nr:extracellular solute-binding protein [Dactylosporangium aurantiacum]MDG6101995.1 extracellular solute-binding protein [Dactylosporangium aurantiacum]UWZ53664.1 extracellular solute-binding protein [Dactylosporangium aurantiacum]
MKYSRTRMAVAIAGALALTSTLVACGSDEDPKADANAKVTLNVVGLLPGSKPEAQQALAAEVTDFQKENPNITVVTKDYEWKATTFAADLAGGTLPTVFEIPFTDAKTLIGNGQIADMQSSLSTLSYASNFNKNVLQYGQGPDGHVYAIPAKSVYAVGLHYNRDLFTKAGLDPSKPPTTWDEVRAAAKAIAEKTGQAGFAQMAKDGTGGWQLTVDTYARGGRLEDGKKATLTNDATKASLQFLKDLRWTDNSMGANFDYDWTGINQAFAAGKVGMYTSGQDVYTSLVQTNNIDPKTYGLTMIPLSGGDSGVLGGGTMAAVSSKASANEKAAAIKWIDYHYLRKYTNAEAAKKAAEIQIASKQPVGTPELPIFTQQQYQQYQEWIKPLVNVPLDQMTTFTGKVFEAKVVNEPPLATQDVYKSLDTVVQAVLTDKNANIDQLLADANTKAQRAIDAAG